MADITPCPGPQELERFLLGVMPQAQAADWEAHVSRCAACERVMAGLPAEDGLVEALRQAPRARLPSGEPVESLRQRFRRLRRRRSACRRGGWVFATAGSTGGNRPCRSLPRPARTG